MAFNWRSNITLGELQDWAEGKEPTVIVGKRREDSGLCTPAVKQYAPKLTEIVRAHFENEKFWRERKLRHMALLLPVLRSRDVKVLRPEGSINVSETARRAHEENPDMIVPVPRGDSWQVYNCRPWACSLGKTVREFIEQNTAMETRT